MRTKDVSLVPSARTAAYYMQESARLVAQLYDLVERATDPDTGEVTPAAWESYQTECHALVADVPRAVAFVEALDAAEDQAKARAAAYAKAGAVAAKARAAMRDALTVAVEAAGGKVDAEGLRLSLRPGRPSVVVDDGADLATWPDGLVRYSAAPDRVALKAALEEGVEVPGAAIVAGKPILTIRAVASHD